MSTRYWCSVGIGITWNGKDVSRSPLTMTSTWCTPSFWMGSTKESRG